MNLYGTAVGANDENTRILAGGLNNPSVYDRAAGGLQVNQLITDFGRTANLTASSQMQAAAENENLELTREQVLLQVDNGYYGALGAQAVLDVARQTLQTRQVLLEQVTALATNQLRSQLDVSFARVQLQQARLLVEQAQNNSDAALATLSTALGYREFHSFQLVDQAVTTNAVGPDVADLSRPRWPTGLNCCNCATSARPRCAWREPCATPACRCWKPSAWLAMPPRMIPVCRMITRQAASNSACRSLPADSTAHASTKPNCGRNPRMNWCARWRTMSFATSALPG